MLTSLAYEQSIATEGVRVLMVVGCRFGKMLDLMSFLDAKKVAGAYLGVGLLYFGHLGSVGLPILFPMILLLSRMIAFTLFRFLFIGSGFVFFCQVVGLSG